MVCFLSSFAVAQTGPKEVGQSDLKQFGSGEQVKGCVAGGQVVGEDHVTHTSLI